MNTLKENPFELIHTQHNAEERFTRTISAWEVPTGVFIRVTATLRDQFNESVTFSPGLKKSDIIPHEKPVRQERVEEPSEVLPNKTKTPKRVTKPKSGSGSRSGKSVSSAGS